MSIAQKIATHLGDVYFGGNWTSVNVKDTLADVTWRQAIAKVETFNTIATLVYHTGYYITAVTGVLQGQPLDAKDAYSFDHTPLQSEKDWADLVNKTLNEAEAFALLIESLPDDKLWETFVDEKYGNYYRNLHGIVEHTHYHLGQIVLIKKMLDKEGTV